MSNAKKEEPHTEGGTLSTKWAISIPLVALIITVVVSNLTMFFDMQSRTGRLGEKITAVASDVTEIKGTLAKFTEETSAELRALRAENVALRAKMNEEVTELKVELATLVAKAGDK